MEEINSEASIATPIGSILKADLPRAMRIAGFQWDDYSKDYILIAEKANGRKINPSDQRRANEKNTIETEVWIPLRYNNFRFALALSKNNIQSALDFAEKRLFENGRPIMLPAKIAKQNPALIDYVSYTKILNLCDDINRDPKNLIILQDYWLGKADNSISKTRNTENHLPFN